MTAKTKPLPRTKTRSAPARKPRGTGGSYQNVLREIDRLQKEAERIRAREKDGVIARIREAIAYYGLLPHELFGQRKRPAASHKTAAAAKKKRAGVPRYGDGHGNVWTGHGRRPQWFKDALEAGASRESLELKG